MSFGGAYSEPDRSNLIDVLDSPRIVLFRLVESILRNDRDLSAVVRTVRAWSGKSSDHLPIGYGESPALVLSLGASRERWWVPGVVSGTMEVDVEVITPGSAVDDLDNVWWLCILALRPRDLDAWRDLYRTLRDAGAWKGTIDVDRTVHDPRPIAGRDRGFRGEARITIDYLDGPEAFRWA